MSLETDIRELTKAVLALTYALNQHPATANPVVVREPNDFTAKVENEIAKALDAEKAEEKKPEVKSKPTTDTLPSSEPEFAEQLASDPVTYDDVKKLIIAISKESKDKAVASLQRFGVANGKQLTESTYPEVVAYLTKVLAGEVNPEESHG
jgi:hypothetical protein